MNEVEAQILSCLDIALSHDNLVAYEASLYERYETEISDMTKQENPAFEMEKPVICSLATRYILSGLINYHLSGEYISWKRLLNRPGVYVIKNITNGRMYIGQSIHLYDRIVSHFAPSGDEGMHYEMRFDRDAFAVNFIYCEREDLNRLEREYIEKYDAVENGYNGNYGYK